MEKLEDTEIEKDTKSADQLNIKLYDFKRPDKFSKEQIRTISIIHETFARLTTVSLSTAMRALAHIHVASVDQLTYEEFIRSIPNPTTLAVINMAPLKGMAVLEIDPSVTGGIINRLFGGQGEGEEMSRELSEIELAVMESILVRMLGDLREAWSTLIDLHPRLGQIETNPQFCQIVPPTEMIVIITFQVKVGSVEGMMNFCIPYITIEPIVSKLTAQYMYSTVRRNPQLNRTAYEISADLPMDTEIFLDSGKHSLRALGQFGKKTSIPLPAWDRGEAILRSGGKDMSRLVRMAPENRRFWKFSFLNRVKTRFESDFSLKDLPVDTGHEKPADTQSFVKILEKGFSRLSDKIESLEHRHNQLSDQFLITGDDVNLQESGAAVSWRPFDFVSISDTDNLKMFIQPEHPQLIALVLSYLAPNMASQILSALPPLIQVNVAERIAGIDRTSPDVVRDIERVLRHKLSVVGRDAADTSVGGIGGIVEILNLTTRSVEKVIIDGLEDRNAELAADIKQHMFVFEDVTLLGDKSIAQVLDRVSDEELALAMKAVTDEEIHETILRALQPERREKIEGMIADLSHIRLSDIEAAQQNIVFQIRKMEDDGEIVVARPDELIE